MQVVCVRNSTYEPEALIDVFVIGAFVEARSCERFYALLRW
jgi:tRNA-(ms[2]io[6]A)-hydroxylase